jgi:hypothetical protein
MADLVNVISANFVGPAFLSEWGKILYTCKLWGLGKVEATNKEGGTYAWEFANRTGTANGAVYVVAIQRGSEPPIILVEQFRPPIEADIIEFIADIVEQ